MSPNKKLRGISSSKKLRDKKVTLAEIVIKEECKINYEDDDNYEDEEDEDINAQDSEREEHEPFG
jgi:hypothetical protein